MICRLTCARGFVCYSYYQSYLLWKRYSSLDRFSAIVGREHLSASRYLNLQGLKVPGGTQQNCHTQVPAQPYAPKSTLHIKCSILRPPKYLPTHLGSNSINVGRSSKIALTNVRLIDNQFTSFKSPKELLSKTSPVT